MQNIFEEYICSISKKFSHPGTSEMGYRKEFEIFLEDIFKAIKVKQFITSYPIESTDTVEKINYEKSSSDKGKVFINSKQYFGNVPEIAWNFFIGGYQPAQKWLKDR